MASAMPLGGISFLSCVAPSVEAATLQEELLMLVS